MTTNRQRKYQAYLAREREQEEAIRTESPEMAARRRKFEAVLAEAERLTLETGFRHHAMHRGREPWHVHNTGHRTP